MGCYEDEMNELVYKGILMLSCSGINISRGSVCSDFHQSLMSALNSSTGSTRGTKMTAFARILTASKPPETLRILCCIGEENVSSRRMLTREFYGTNTEEKEDGEEEGEEKK
ncbi:hypothetical protein Tco_0708471 [Tanacetum coccineum]